MMEELKSWRANVARLGSQNKRIVFRNTTSATLPDSSLSFGLARCRAELETFYPQVRELETKSLWTSFYNSNQEGA